MAPKGSQPLLDQIHKKRFLGSQVHFEIFGSEVWKNLFVYSLTFHNGRCAKNMNFQKVVFYTSDTIDSRSNYTILGSGKVFL